MKHACCALVLLFAATNSWCAKKITVAQLEDLLRSMQQEKKSDAETATALKQLELSQELTRNKMNGLVSYVPGPRSTEQIYVLEARSANLVPPESDLPSTPAPDPSVQKAILEKTSAYISGTYAQLPQLTATKTTLRFQDNVEAVQATSGLQGGAQDVVVGSGFSNPATFVHYINSSESQVVSAHGIEKPPAQKDKTPWGANKMIALQTPDPSLVDIFNEAEKSESLQWLRWESVNGKPAAVFSFAVPRKNSHLDLTVCCFPDITQTGVANFYTSTTAATLGGGASGGGGVAGNFQTNTNWHPYKSAAPYHGELFIDPDSGVVVRTIVQAELKPSEVVHELDRRIDFGSAKVGGKMFIVPVKTYTNTLVVPNGDSGASTYSTRRTLFTSEFKDYERADGK